MLEARVNIFMAASEQLGEVIGRLDELTAEGAWVGPYEPHIEAARKAIDGLSRGMVWSPVLALQASRTRARIGDLMVTGAEAMSLLRDLHESVRTEMESHLFLMVPPAHIELMRQAEPFGAAVAEAFPDAKKDVAAAARSFALDEHTASVFHLMRAAEHVLRWLARDLLIADVDTKDWVRLIQDVKGQLDALRQQPRHTPDRDKEMEFRATALASLDLFKDAWRNPVSHSRAHYDERDATPVLNGVRSFMQLLADRVLEAEAANEVKRLEAPDGQ